MLNGTTFASLDRFGGKLPRMTAEEKSSRSLWFWLFITLLLAVLPWFLF
jgi:hypothetical protein